MGFNLKEMKDSDLGKEMEVVPPINIEKSC